MSQPGALCIVSAPAPARNPDALRREIRMGACRPGQPGESASLPRRSIRQWFLLAALATLMVTLVSSPAHALTDALCGQAISGTVILTEDLDCTGHPGAPDTGAPPGTVPGAALTISADDTTLDGSGCMATLNRNCRILAPDSAYAVYAKNWKNVTVQNLSVDGWCNGVGIYIEGGRPHRRRPWPPHRECRGQRANYGVHVFQHEPESRSAT